MLTVIVTVCRQKLANSEDSDQTWRPDQTDLCPHCQPRSVCYNRFKVNSFFRIFLFLFLCFKSLMMQSEFPMTFISLSNWQSFLCLLKDWNNTEWNSVMYIAGLKCGAIIFRSSPQSGGIAGTITLCQNSGFCLEKYFKEYSWHVYVMELGPRGTGTKSRAVTISLSLQCGAYNRALRNEVIIPAIHLGPGVGAVVTNDWCIISCDG